MGESVFEVVKQSVTAREAAELYGIAVGRGGMACCPFHDDRHPSMKVDTRFHCFGCGADGDVIDFTARLYDLSSKEAAEKLAQDFGLAYDSKAPIRRNYARQKSEAQVRKEKREHGWRILTNYYHLLRKWEADYSPRTPDEDPHPRFLEAIQKKEYMGYLLDTFLDSSTAEQDQWIAEHTAEISAIEGRVNIMADKPTNRERLQQITAGIEQGIKELFESEKYMRYLSVMSRFHRYSVNNTMLIYMQRPDATLVAGYNKWKNQFERHVKRGEHGITIIAPTPFKKKIEEQKLDPDTKAPMLDAEGKIIMEEREVEIPMFRPVKVFDVSQTDGKPLPELASSLSGNVQNYEAFMEALRRSAPVPLSVEPMAENMDGYFSPDQQRIAIREGMSEVQTVSAAVHEIAHSKLHNYAKAQEEAARAGDKEPPKKKDRNTEEVEAESISYAVCQYYGIQTGENSFGYIANWSQGKELPELRASLETINKTAGELINDIDRHYKVICKERGIDLTAAPEPQLDPIEQLAADIDQFSFDYDTYEYRDQVDNREDALRELTATLRSGDASGVRDWLQEFADENEPGEAVTKAAELLDRLDQLVPEPDPNLVKMADEARAMGVDTAWNSDKEFPVSFDTERTQPSAEAQEALLLVDDATYLHVQSCDTGWDYTLYDAATMKQLDGGQLDAPELSLSTAALKICEMRGMGGQSIRYAPLSMIETLQEAAIQQMQAAAQAAVPEVTQLPDAPEQALDEYPMPDPALTQDDLEKCGYLDSDLLPLSKERAYELMAQDLTVYMVQQGENPAMAFDTADLDAHDGIFAVTREEWEDSPSFDAQVMDRMDHQQEREQAFLNHKGDCYAIYQVKHTDELRDIRYEGLEWVKSIGRTVQRDNYDLVYTAPLTPGDLKGSVLDNLEYRFNNEHPADYRHPSMSVSDIVAIKQDGKVSCHYCDSFGFQQIPGFLPDNPLKSAEMTVEDDYGMIDGVINNGTKEPTVAQLEQQARRLERKADMFTKRTIKPHEAVTTVDTASEALAVSISEKACVDMAYMEQLTGKTGEELADELRGVIFRVPGQTEPDGTPHYVTADEYLSGNVRRKLRQAQRAAEQDPAFAVNVEALTAAQPKDLDASEIEVRLGATWIDKEYIQQFMYETFDTPFYLQRSIEVHYTPFTAEWQISGKNVVGQNNVAAYSTYGTGRANAYKILEDSLNLRDVRIYDTVEDADGKERRVLNAKETTLAAQKQQAIREAFKDWIWRDPERRQALVRQYNEEMNATRPREYDGSHIVFGGMNPSITLREHQKNAIAHVLYGGNTLLAHEVGAGKTFEMVGAAMEAKRLGLCQKSLFVVPNHLTEQWASEFLRLYPSANILVTTKKDFEKHNRKKFCARIATGDYDAIIMGHSQFEKIPISKERQERLLHEQIWEITEGISEVESSGGERFTVKQLERTKKSLEARLEKLQAEGRKDDVVTFEQLGVDRLFVDEAHNYKNRAKRCA